MCRLSCGIVQRSVKVLTRPSSVDFHQEHDLLDLLLTWCYGLESFLHFCDKGFDIGWGTSPEHKAVSGVLETWLDAWVLQLLQYGIDRHARKVWRGELFLLLDASVASMDFVAALDLCLEFVRHCGA